MTLLITLITTILINNFIYDLDISLENVTYYPTLYPIILSIFISKNDTIELFNCLELNQNCIFYFENIIYVNLGGVLLFISSRLRFF